MKETVESASDSLRSSVSSPGMPKTCRTPSASRHSTKTSEARRLLTYPAPYSVDRNSKPAAEFDPMMRRSALLAAIVALVAATPAWAASTLTINGAGFGHGIGMSQYGAAGYAEHGWNHVADPRSTTSRAPQLGHTDSRPGRARAAAVDVAAAVHRRDQRRRRRSSIPAKTYSARARGDAGRPAQRGRAAHRHLRRAAAAHQRRRRPVQALGTAGNGVLNGQYRGWLELRPGAGGLLAINAVGLEQYVARRDRQRGDPVAGRPRRWRPRRSPPAGTRSPPSRAATTASTSTPTPARRSTAAWRARRRRRTRRPTRPPARS